MEHWDTLILTEPEVNRLKGILDDFTLRANTHSSMISLLSGQMLISSGFQGPFNLLALSALLSGVFQSTRELARLIGEHKFNIFFQEGKKWNIYYTLIMDEFILTTFFDDRTILGIVEVQAKNFAKKLQKLLTKENEHSQS